MTRSSRLAIRFGRQLAGLALLLALALPAQAQVCTGNALLTSQASVNAFACTSVTGTLFVSGADITSLAPLSSLTSVGADVLIQNNTLLTSLNGLGSLEAVGGSITAFGNNALTSLSALSKISSVPGNLILQNNVVLPSLDGLGALTSVGGDLRIQNNALLTSISALGQVQSVGRDLLFYDNAALTSLDGLGALTTVAQDVFIQNNDALTSIDALGALTSVGRTLAVRGNDALATCACGLDGLISDGAFTNGGPVDISNNAPDSTCNSPAVVIETPCAVACAVGTGLSFLEGGPFDADGDLDGEVVSIFNLSPVPVQTAGCAFGFFDPFTEQLTYSFDLFEGIIPGAGDVIAGVGYGPFPNAIPDGPGAVVLIEGTVPIGASVADVLPQLVSGMVYRSDTDILAIYSSYQAAATSSDDFLAAIASLSQSVANEDGTGAIDLNVAAAPNPFRDHTRIAFGVAEATNVRVSVYDALGREVARLADGPYGIGRHELTFEARDLPTGIYVIRVIVGTEARTARVTLTR